MLIKDSIENTEKYREAMLEINSIFEKQYGTGICHSYWDRKKELLKIYGIEWKSPAEINPDVRFN